MTRQQDFVTCFGIDHKEILGISTCNPVSQLFIGAGVRVLGLDLNDRYILRGVFHDSWVIDGFRGERGIVIHVLHFNVHFNGRVERDDPVVSRVHCQPVGLGCLPIENICCVDNSCRKTASRRSQGEDQWKNTSLLIWQYYRNVLRFIKYFNLTKAKHVHISKTAIASWTLLNISVLCITIFFCVRRWLFLSVLVS